VFGIGLNGHLISTVSATPASAAITAAHGITAAAIVVGSSDTAGGFTTTGTQDNSADSTLTVTFGKTYTTAPKAVMLTPTNAAAALTGSGPAYISSIAATGFVVGISKSGTTAATPSWGYIVIA
jgi:pyrroline-5-carboxylate reductase